MATLRAYEIGEMNLAAWEETANIYAYTRKAGKPVEDTDILIAAFCIVTITPSLPTMLSTLRV